MRAEVRLHSSLRWRSRVRISIASKQKLKQRSMNSRAPSTIANAALWDNRFRGFLQHTLKAEYVNRGPRLTLSSSADHLRSLATCPTADQIQRFLYEFTKHLSPRSPYGVLAYKTLVTGLDHILQATKTRFPHFRLEKGEAQRIKVVFHDLLQSGALTKDPRHQKLWITARMGHKMCESLALDALQNGCRSWDIVLQRLLSISLLIATAAQPGEIARSSLYTGPQYMTFGDAQVRLKPHGAQTEVLEASIALRWRQGDKSFCHHQSHLRLH